MSEVQHYSVATAKTGFLHHALRLPEFPRTLVRSRELLWNFARRDLLARFRGSLLGVLWVLVHPLFLFSVYFAVFGILFAPATKLAADGPDPQFAIYLFSGIVSFSWITESLGTGMAAIVGNANLVKKVRFPCELLPLVPPLVGGVVYVVGCVVLLVAGLIAGRAEIGPAIAFWPLLVLIHLGFICGLGMFLAAVNVFIRDVSHLWRVFAQAWFFLTPIFWELDLIREKLGAVGLGSLADLLLLNPASPIVLAQRQVFGIGQDLPPELLAARYPYSLTTNLMMGGMWAVFFMFVGYGFFSSRRHKFADLV